MQKLKFLYFCSLGSFLASSLSLIFVLLIDLDGEILDRIFSYMVAAIFWLGILIGIVFLGFAIKQKNILIKKLKKNINRIPVFKNIGIISFFRNKFASVADVFLVLMIILLIVLVIFKVNIEWLIILNVVFLYFSVILHSFFNGKNYRYIKYFEKIKEMQRKVKKDV